MSAFLPGSLAAPEPDEKLKWLSSAHVLENQCPGCSSLDVRCNGEQVPPVDGESELVKFWSCMDCGHVWVTLVAFDES